LTKLAFCGILLGMNPQALPTKKEIDRLKKSAAEQMEDLFDTVAVIRALEEVRNNPGDDQWVTLEELKQSLA